MSASSNCLLAVAAALLEVCIGYPAVIYRAIGHPVGWMGRLLGLLEALLNKQKYSAVGRRYLGAATLSLYLSVCGLAAFSIVWMSLKIPFGIIILILVASTLLAQRSLHDHVLAVAHALESGGIEEARIAVSMIVGRETEGLDEAAISRAAIESLAENFSDGVVAPLFWLAAFGLPGGVLYKAANTADSMIGHKNERYAAFGWAAARFDDLVNLPCSRLAALWLVLAALIEPGASASSAIRAVSRDARRHRSPNAGWPEAAMAGALGLKLGGPRMYGKELADVAFMGDGRYDLTRWDIRKALSLYRIACSVQIAVLAFLLVLLGVIG